MDDVCPKCGLPRNLCVCVEISKEEQRIKIKTVQRRFGKKVTIISGLGENASGILKELKRKLACGGTLKNKEIELQGGHKSKVKEFLLQQGFKEEFIDD